MPLFRVPAFQKYVSPGADLNRDSTFVKLYAEPGVGYRADGGPFGGYTSAKMLFLLTNKSGWQPYLEIQRRFPFDAPLQGDNRIAIGVMASLCEHCDWN